MIDNGIHPDDDYPPEVWEAALTRHGRRQQLVTVDLLETPDGEPLGVDRQEATATIMVIPKAQMDAIAREQQA